MIIENSSARTCDIADDIIHVIVIVVVVDVVILAIYTNILDRIG